MVIIETSIFTCQIQALMDDENYAEFQSELSKDQLRMLRVLVQKEFDDGR